MGKRSRRRAKKAGTDQVPASDYSGPDREVLRLRDELTPGTLAKLGDLDAKPAADSEDRWQRRVEFLFERLAVRWEIAGLPLEGQKELLGRYRMAGADERRRVRQTLAEHLRTRYPDVEV